MENATIGGIVSVLGGGLVWLLGGWHVTLTALSIFMTVEVVLRIIAVIANKKRFTSNDMFKNFGKKVGIIVVIILANQLDMIAGGTPIFRGLAVLYYIGVEGLSIKEHLSSIGLFFPKAIEEKIDSMQKEDKQE